MCNPPSKTPALPIASDSCHHKLLIRTLPLCDSKSVCEQVRLMLVLAPATCCLGGIAADQILSTFCKSIRPEEGSGGWSGIFKTWLDGPEAQTQEDTVSVDAKPAASSTTTSSAGTGKRYKGSARVGYHTHPCFARVGTPENVTQSTFHFFD